MNIKIDLSGLERLRRNAEAFHGTHQVKLTEILNPEFMRIHSRFSSIQEMLTQCGVSADTLAAMTDAEKNDLARRGTTCDSWQEFINAAVAEYAKKQLFK